MNNTPSLPGLASYKTQCHHSSGNWLAYQEGLETVRLIEFTSNRSIEQNFKINIGQQPLKSLRVVYSPQEKEVYVGLALLTKYMVLKGNKPLCTFNISLTCNITDFSDGVVAVDGINDGVQTYFVFSTSLGQLTTISVSHPETKVNFKTGTDSNITSLCIKPGFAFLGTERGKVLKVDMNSRKIIDHYQSGSSFPIYNIRIANSFLIFGTCQGELHILFHDLQESKVVSAHEGMVTLLHVNKNNIFSVGDDLVLRKWTISKDGTIQETSHQFYDQKPNLLFTASNTTFINFYEETELVEL